MTALRTAANAIDTASEFQTASAVSSAPSDIGVTVTGGSSPATHEVSVSQLAQSEMEISQGYAGLFDDVGTGTFSVTVGTTTTAVSANATDGTNTLQGLADAISAQVAGATAFIMNTGDSSAPYRLVVTSDDSGAANALSFSSTLSGGTAPTMVQQRAAQDAAATVNGIAVAPRPMS